MALFSDVDKKAAVKAAMVAAGGVAGGWLSNKLQEEAKKKTDGTWQKWVLDNAGLAEALLGFGVYAFGRKQKGLKDISEALGMGMMVAGSLDFIQDHVTFKGPSLGSYVPNAYMNPIHQQPALSGGNNLGAYESSYHGAPSASSSRGRIV